jgi:hypothetical protein
LNHRDDVFVVRLRFVARAAGNECQYERARMRDRD